MTSFNSSEPHFSHLQNRDNNTCLQAWLQEFKEIMLGLSVINGKVGFTKPFTRLITWIITQGHKLYLGT